MEQMIEKTTVETHLQKVLKLKASYEAHKERLTKDLEEANALSDRYKAGSILTEMKLYNGWIKGVDDAIATLEPLFKLVEPKEVK